MWTQQADPLSSLALSAIVAAIPILVFLICLVVLRMKGTTAGIIAVVLAIVVAVWPFGMPFGKVMGAGALGVLSGLWPIAWIVVLAVWLYRIVVAAGLFDVIRASICSISADQRMQVLLIAFAFGAFLEGVAGFGVPIAICAALLVQLGFAPIRAAMLSLIANVAAGAYGAIGIPVIVGAAQIGKTPADLAWPLILLLQIITVFVPALLIVIVDGVRGLRETWHFALVTGVVFSGVQCLVLLLSGPALVDILGGLAGMVTLAVMLKIRQPRRIFRLPGSPEVDLERFPAKRVAVAWSPFLILTAAILVWSLPAFQAMFAPGGALAWLKITVPIPGLDGLVQLSPELGGATLSATWAFTPVNATGTAILVAVIITSLAIHSITFPLVRAEFAGTIAQLWRPISLILMVLTVAYISDYSGGSATIGLALAAVGTIFPLLSPVIGWFGVFVTGSVVNNNVLFANLQAVTGTHIGVDPTLLVAANTAGGVMAKAVSPQSIAIAAGAVGLGGKESSILRAALPYSLVLLAVVCVLTMGAALV